MNQERKIARLALAMLATIESHRSEGLSLEHLGVLYSNHSDAYRCLALNELISDCDVQYFKGFDGESWVRGSLYTNNEG